MKKFIFVLMFILLSVQVSAVGNLVDTGDNIVVNQTKIENGYYIANSVDLLSGVKGDVHAVSSYFKSQNVIDEDLNVLASKVDIYGVVGDDARVVSSELFLDNVVFGDLVVFVSKYDSGSNAQVGDTAYISGDYVILKGRYDGDVYISANKVYVDAVVAGDLFVDASFLEVASSSILLGDAELTDNLKINESLVDGAITFIPRKAWGEDFEGVSFSVGDWFLTLVTIFVTGLAFLLVGKEYSKKVDTTLMRRPFYSFLLGLAVLILMPVVAVILLLTLVGSTLGLILFAAYVAMLLLSASIGAWYMGGLFMSIFNMEDYKYLKFAVGCVLFMLIALIPVIGPIVVVVASIMGMGAFFRNFYGKDRAKPKNRQNKFKSTKKKSAKKKSKRKKK